MIEITQTPGRICFAGNPVFFEAFSDNFQTSMGVPAYFELVVSGIDINAGRKFTLGFNGKALEFQSADFVCFDGLSFEKAYVGESFNVFAENIYGVFLENYEIQKYFNVSLDPAGLSQRRIILQAKEAGADFSVVLSNVGVQGVSQGVNTPGTDSLFRDYFGILCLIRDVQNNVIGEEIKPTDVIGSVKFDISDYLKSKFAMWEMPRFEFPELPGNVRQHGWDYLLKYRVSLAESIAGNVKGLLSDVWSYALAGGLSRELQASLNEKSLEYFSVSENKLRFLSWLPTTKYSCSAVMEKLFFLFQDTIATTHYRLVVLVTFTDGLHKEIAANGLSAITAFSVVELKVGFDHLDLSNAVAGKTVHSWEVYFVDQNDERISESRVFINDTRYFENEKVFFYRNSFSGYDTFRFVGRSELNLEYERSIGSTIKEEKFTFFNAPSRQFSGKETVVTKANSGWISLEEKNCLRELLLSGECYEQIGAELFPLVINTAKVTPFLKDGEYLYNLEIEYDRSYQNTFFSVHVPKITAIPILIMQPLSWDSIEVSFDDMEITFDLIEF